MFDILNIIFTTFFKQRRIWNIIYFWKFINLNFLGSAISYRKEANTNCHHSCASTSSRLKFIVFSQGERSWSWSKILTQLFKNNDKTWSGPKVLIHLLGFYRYRYNTAIYTGNGTVFWVPVFFVKYRKYRYFPVFFFILALLFITCRPILFGFHLWK